MGESVHVGSSPTRRELCAQGGPSTRMIAQMPNEPVTLWRFTKDRRDAYCLLLPHPEGGELRYFFNGVVLIGMVSREQEQLLDRARQWRLRLVGEGWVEIEHASRAAVGA